MLKMSNLEACFKLAKIDGAAFIGVEIKTEGYEGNELIINPNVNFDKKLEYYQKAYNDDLTLKTFNGIRIVGFTYGDSPKQIVDNLLKISKNQHFKRCRI